jgi:hypothetical protein
MLFPDYKLFLLTSFIEPLKEPRWLSKELGFYFDNPKNENEIEMIAKFINANVYNSEIHSHFKFPRTLHEADGNEDILNLTEGVKSWHNFYKKSKETFVKPTEVKDPIREIAKLWVICRFDDKGHVQEKNKQLEENEKTGSRWFRFYSQEESVFTQPKLLNEYVSILSFLGSYVDSYPDNSKSSVIINSHTNDLISPSQINKKLINTFGFWAMRSYRPEDQEITHTLDYNRFMESIKGYIPIMESAFRSKNKQLLLYIFREFSYIDDVDERTKVVRLVGIIEMLLTHNPDFKRYNVEDSITKQFVLKLSIIIYAKNKKINLDNLKKRLKFIYSIRSMIAHGDYKNLNKEIEKEYKKNLEDCIDQEEDVAFVSRETLFEDINNDLILYFHTLLETYLNEPEYILFLKDN